jgi:hypothetical protein
MTKHEMLETLKDVYHKTLDSFNLSYSEDDFKKLRDAEKSYMLCLESEDSFVLNG